jgi:hypothetical protein
VLLSFSVHDEWVCKINDDQGREINRPERGNALGRLTAVIGSVRATFERRQRLRQCLIKAGAENLPDYELLQVMLFTSNPHADVESLVGELLDRFGTLAEVMSADLFGAAPLTRFHAAVGFKLATPSAVLIDGSVLVEGSMTR